MIKAFTISALVCSLLQSAFACTTALVTKGASADGSVFVTHSNDGYTGDTSVVYVPASDHAEGEKRAVYPSACAREPYPTYNTDYTPRLNVKGRGPDYQFKGEKETLPLGYIPQVKHTYAYLDSNYGIINEHGLMLGECTEESDTYILIKLKVSFTHQSLAESHLKDVKKLVRLLYLWENSLMSTVFGEQQKLF